MIVEKATLCVKSDLTDAFENEFRKASEIIARQEGYISHYLYKNHSTANEYLLVVEWQTIENHQIGFRQSNDYQLWKKLLHHFYDPFPKVEYFNLVYSK